MFTKFKEKIVKDYCYLTVLLLLFVSFSLYIVGFSISYKSQLSHIKMLAIEESEDLFYKINTKDLKNFPKDDDNSPARLKKIIISIKFSSMDIPKTIN